MYIAEIIHYLLWPFVIWISWILVKYFYGMYEKSRPGQKQ